MPRLAGEGQLTAWVQRYPPALSAFVIALLLAVAILPSKLNQPQTNPSETLEYAPVPSDEALQQGNLSSLGVASSSLAPAEQLPTTIPTPGSSRRSSTKRCVGNPPRQTEDPLSPPCVAFFTGNNGGATHVGVTRDEIRAFESYFGICGSYITVTGSSRGTNERWHCRKYTDMDLPPEEDEFVYLRMLRLYQVYFNERYQTYNRRVHFFAYEPGTPATPEQRAADAADHFEKVKPFTVSSQISANIGPYIDVLAGKGVMNFLPGGTASIGGVDETFFTKYPKQVLGYDPSVQYRAKGFANYVCTQVVPFSISFGGNDGNPDARLHNGQPRRLGLMSLDQPEFYPTLRTYRDIVKAEVEKCSGNPNIFVAERTFPNYCNSGGCDPSGTYAADNMAYFQQQGISTIIWAGGEEQNQGIAAAKIGYLPEIVLGGDNLVEVTLEGQTQDQTFWRNVFAYTTYERTVPIEQAPCYQAAKEVDPNAPDIDIRNFGCKIYPSLRQLFIGIQVAGPKLNPVEMDRGFRAIPSIASNSPYVPACFYPAGDYTCVKDAVIQWWDPSGDDPGSTNPGCMKLLEGGKRYLPGTWPNENVHTRKNPSADACNTEGATI